jgi:thymidylate kinase
VNISKTQTVPPLVVDFIGLPGAGKTTLSRRVASELNSAGHKCLTQEAWAELRRDHRRYSRVSLKDVYRCFVFCICHMEVLFYALSYAFQVTPLNIRTLRRGVTFVRKLYKLKKIVREAARWGYDIVFFDQGLMLHVSWIAVPASPPPDISLIRLLKSVSGEMPQACVLFDVDVPTAIERITKRSTIVDSHQAGFGVPQMAHSRHASGGPISSSQSLAKMSRRFFELRGISSPESFLGRYEGYVENIVNCAAQLNGACRSLRVNGNDDVGEIASSIVRFIDEIWQTRDRRIPGLEAVQ